MNRAWWRTLLALLRKELLQLSRDALLLIFIVYAFTFDIYTSTAGTSYGLRNAMILVRDPDHSAATRELTYLFRPPYFRLKREELPSPGTFSLLETGEAMAFMRFPDHFERSLIGDRSGELQLLIDGSNSLLALLAANYATSIIDGFSVRTGLSRIGMGSDDLKSLPWIDIRNRVWFNPNEDETWLISLQELIQMITLLAILLPAAALAREKERGTVEQLLVSPLSPAQIILPKVLSMVVVILAGTAVALFLVLDPIFGVPMKGSLLLYFGITTYYVCIIAGLGLFAATISRTLAQAGMLSLLIFAPMLLLSGTITPPEAMPRWVQGIVTWSPMAHYVDITYGIMLKGAGLGMLWDSLAHMTALGAMIFAFTLLRFRRQFG